MRIDDRLVGNGQPAVVEDHLEGIESDLAIADVLVVSKDPLKDIRVLQDKAAIRAVFKGGAPIDLEPRLPRVEKWPWERILAISGSELYYDTVYRTTS